MTKNSSNYSLSSDYSHNNSNSNLRNSSFNIETGSSNSNVSILNCSSSTQLNDSHHNRRSYDHYRNESDGIESSGMESDDLLEDSNFANLSNQEKQEIKTVRIVKRESRERARDREKSGYSSSSQNMDHISEDKPIFQTNPYDSYTNHSKSLPKNYVDHEMYHQGNARSPNEPTNYSDYYNNLVNNQYPVSMTDYKPTPPPAPQHSQSASTVPEQPKYSTVNKLSKSNHTNNNNNNLMHIQQQQSLQPLGLRNKTESIQSLTKVVGDPVFQSEAARQIMIEMSSTPEENGRVPSSSKQRRAIPKEKRRHYTAPHHVNAKSIQSMQAENDMNKTVNNNFIMEFFV